MRVGVEVQGGLADVASAVATLPWMGPERIVLDDDRFLVVVTTSFENGPEACAYAERRLRKSVMALGLEVDVLSTEAYPEVIDLRPIRDLF